MKYAFYSQKQYNRCGGAVWRTAEGRNVLITAVSDTHDSGCGWDDMQFVGMVTEYVRDAGLRAYSKDKKEHGLYKDNFKS